jgi:hypothetical protein
LQTCPWPTPPLEGAGVASRLNRRCYPDILPKTGLTSHRVYFYQLKLLLPVVWLEIRGLAQEAEVALPLLVCHLSGKKGRELERLEGKKYSNPTV